VSKLFQTDYYFVELEDEDASVGITPTGVIFSYRVVNQRSKATEGFFFTLPDAIEACKLLSDQLDVLRNMTPELFVEEQPKRVLGIVKSEDITH